MVLLSLLILSSINAHTQNLPWKSKGGLVMYVDAYQYQGSKRETIVDLSYSIDLSYFKYIDFEKRTPNMVINIDIYDVDNYPLLKDSFNIDPIRIRNQNYHSVGQQRIKVSQDTIIVNIRFNDLLLNRQCTVVGHLPIKKFNASPSLSDLFYIKDILKDKSYKEFEKGGLYLIPLTDRTYYKNYGNKNAYIYYEINNMPHSLENQSWYQSEYTVRDNLDNIILNTVSDSVLIQAPNSSRIEIIPITGLKPGKYNIRISNKDLTTGLENYSSGMFSILDNKTSQNLMLPMNDEDVAKYLNQIRYIASNKEKKLFKKLPHEGKQEFILSFWNRRDPNPETAENEFLIEHFRRMKISESQFRGGSDSDMGRIMIVYGSPLDINRNFSSTSFNKPLEIWLYALNGKTEFVFVDRMEDGQYKLVHSTHKDEIYNSNWAMDFK